MSKSNVKVAPALAPRRIANVSPACWYAMHEPSAATLVDKLGNGPTFTMAAGTADALGRLAPAASNTTDYATAPADPYLFDVLRLDTMMASGVDQLIIAYDYQSTSAAVAATNSIFTAGQMVSYAGAKGALCLQINTAECPSVSIRNTGVSTAAFAGAATGAGLASTLRTAVVIDARKGVGNSVNMTFHTLNSAGLSTTTSANAVTDGGSGLGVFGSEGDGGYAIGARHTAVYDQLLNAGAGDGASLQNLLFMRKAVRDSALAARLVAEMVRYPNEWPQCLNGV